MSNVILKISKLNFKNVLTDISFEISQNDFITITGPNGGGKSTIAKLILNILKPDNGEIKFYKDLKNKIAYVPQNTSITDEIFPATVEEIIETAFAFRDYFFKRISKKEKSYINSLMEKLDILDFKYKLFSELSGGQKQKVLIIRALVNKPEFLILDEPDTALDINSKNELINILEKINKEENTTILYITHNIELIKKNTTKILNINGVLNC